mgnify:CR=1 FL=1
MSMAWRRMRRKAEASSGGLNQSASVAATAARRLGLAHRVVDAPPPSLVRLRNALFHLEAPDAFSAWGMATSTLALAERVRADGVRVLLAGEGADEVFLGYPWHRAEAAGERGFELGRTDVVTRYAGGGAALRLALLRQQAHLAGKHPTALRGWLRLQRASFDEAGVRALSLLREQVAPDEVPPWPTRAGSPGERRVPHAARGRQLDALGVEMLMLPVLHADRLFLAHGVEVRMPFLDEDLVAAALRLPAQRLEVAAREKPLVYAIAERVRRGLGRGKQKRGFTAAPRPGDDEVRRLARALSQQGLVHLGGDALARELAAAAHGDVVAVDVLWRAILLEETARCMMSSSPHPGRTP